MQVCSCNWPGCDAMEFLLSIWYSFDLVTSIKVNQKPADFVRRCKEINSSGDMLMRLTHIAGKVSLC